MSYEATNSGSLGGDGRSSTSPGGSGDAAGGAVQATKDVAGAAAQQAADVMDQAKQQIHTLTGQARDELQTQLGTQGERAASSLRTWSTQLEAFADGRTYEAGPLPGYVRDAQRRVQSIAARLEEGGPQGIIDDVGSFARRRSRNRASSA